MPQPGCSLLLLMMAVSGLQTQEYSFLSPAATLAYDLKLGLASQTRNPSIRNENIMILIYELTVAQETK